MLKMMKKVMCRVLAFAMILSVVSVPNVSKVSATEADIIWQQQYYQDFDKLTSLADTDEIVYTDAAVELQDDSSGGQYLKLTPANVTEAQTDSQNASSKWCMELKPFENTTGANSVKIEYQVKFTEVPETADVSKWSSYSGMHAKAYATGRAWAARVSAAKSALQNTTATTLTANENWYTITEKVTKSNDAYTWVTELSQNGSVIDSASKTCSGMFASYLMGCDATGTGIYVDNIKVSYGYSKPENLTLDFENSEEESAFTHDKVFMQNTTATVKSNETDGAFLRLTCTDSTSTTKNSVQINAFDGFSLAKIVTVEYKARIPECSECPGTETTNDTFSKHPSLNTKFKGFAANGTTTANIWATKVSHYKTQANSSAVRDTVNVGADWFTVKHIIDNTVTTNNLTTSVTAKDGTNHSNTVTYVPATISYYELIATDITIMEYIDVDDIKVTYTFEDEAKAPEATVAVYAGDEAQTNLTAASALTDKVVVTFSEAMNTSTVTQNSVYIENSDGGKIGCGVAFDASNKVYTMTIPTLLPAGTYKVVITADAKSEADTSAVAKTVEFTVASGEATLPTETYSEDYILDFDDLMADTTPTDVENVIYYNATANPKIVSGGVTGNALSLTPRTATASNDYSGGTNQKWTVSFKNINAGTNADKVVISYDVKSAATESSTEDTVTWGYSVAMDKLYKASNSREWGVRLGSKKYQLANNATAVSMETDISKWTTISYTYDPTDKTVVNAFTCDGVTTECEPVKVSGLIGLILAGEAHTADILVDNIKVSYIYNEPTVTPESITFVDSSNELQENWNDIDLLTKSISVDFGAVMDTTTLTGNNIYITKKGDTAKIGYIADYSDGIYTMSLTESLAESTTYTLVISKDTENVSGAKLSNTENVTIDFTTGKGKRKAELIAVKVNGEKVTDVSGLTASADGQIEIDYTNTTGKAQTINIIIAYYAGDMLKTAELVQTDNIDASIVKMTYKYDFNILEDMSDVTSVKVMSWNSFGEMIPLSDSIDL